MQPLTALAALWVLVASALYWIGRRRPSIALIAAILIDVTVNKVVKYSLAMPRPDPSRWVIEPEDPYGFPSGHAETAFLAAAFLSSIDRRALPLFALAGMVGYSRVLLGSTTPSTSWEGRS